MPSRVCVLGVVLFCACGATPSVGQPDGSGAPPTDGGACDDAIAQLGSMVTPAVVTPPDGGTLGSAIPSGGTISAGTYTLTGAVVRLSAALCCSIVDPAWTEPREETVVVTGTQPDFTFVSRETLADGGTFVTASAIVLQDPGSYTSTQLCSTCVKDCLPQTPQEYAAGPTSFTLFTQVQIDEEHLGNMQETFTLAQ